MNEAHGKHVYVDYVGFQPNQRSQDGRWILKILQNAVNKCGIREVHSHVEIFDGKHSPPGFAAVVLIDESHVSAHCYSDRGWLAIDAFTCGGHDPENIVDIIHEHLVSSSPNIIQMRRDTVNRFLHTRGIGTDEDRDSNQ
ncbi:MAG TPA: adenosylmethionine decarboxylase [Candidatus Thalassarchaeaceae archaeon]|nr:adenosylmethionine decarboxylase [Euryarchaeota archaeon]DAC45126.1 MAG TPA: adenosylmethionine decarboxylase [Candidatus Poseidoniales archaeon]HII89530.1 adenosylmethionine decarboxylase [Candidatus Thalassarchaeaceae archaeon]